MAIGDLAFTLDVSVKRRLWKMGVIEMLINGRDGQLRGARVNKLDRSKLKFANRPLSKLFQHEISSGNDMC